MGGAASTTSTASPADNIPCAPGYVLKDGQCVLPGAGSHPADDRISEDQWNAWEKFKDPSCPTNSPYKSERGAQGCFEKPVDCPDGQMPSGPNTTDPCMPNPGGGGGGGGGQAGMSGGGGNNPGFNQWTSTLPFDQWAIEYGKTQAARTGDKSWLGPLSAKQLAQAHMYYDRAASTRGTGGAGGGAFGSFGPGSTTSEAIAAQLQKIMSGEDATYNPKVVAGITGQNKLNEQAAIARQSEALRENQATRGVLNSPAGAAQEQRIVTAAGSAFDQNQNQLMMEKAKQDFTDKMGGLKAAQDWLNSLRNYALGMDSNSVQREGILANVTLGREKIAAELEMQLKDIAGRKDLLGMQLDSNEAMQLQKLLLCIQTGVC